MSWRGRIAKYVCQENKCIKVTNKPHNLIILHLLTIFLRPTEAFMFFLLNYLYSTIQCDLPPLRPHCGLL